MPARTVSDKECVALGVPRSFQHRQSCLFCPCAPAWVRFRQLEHPHALAAGVIPHGDGAIAAPRDKQLWRKSADGQ